MFFLKLGIIAHTKNNKTHNAFSTQKMNIKKQKQTLLDQLYAPLIACQKCPLGSLGRNNVVFGKGNPDAKIMLIGEGPGRDEDIQGKPFVGRSGKLLNELLIALGINPEETYISNIVKCRPPNNRAPLPDEANTCKKLLLHQQIKIIQPKVICTLGSTALNHLLDKDFQITKIRGTVLKFKAVTVVPTFHPAYILRNQSKLIILANDLELVLRLANQEN